MQYQQFDLTGWDKPGEPDRFINRRTLEIRVNPTIDNQTHVARDYPGYRITSIDVWSDGLIMGYTGQRHVVTSPAEIFAPAEE